jgi:ethanolamine utilization protein EutQ (cupin superfamily)
VLQALIVDPAEYATKTEGSPMSVGKFAITDASFARTPGQDAEVFVGNVIDQRHGGPITIGFGRYGPNQSIDETIAVDDVMVVLEGRLSVSTGAGTVTAGPGEIVYMPKGEAVTIRSHEQGAITAYVTYPHWQEPLA